MPNTTSTLVRAVKTISWNWPPTPSHCSVSGFDSPLTLMASLPMPIILILDFLKDPRWDFHFWYHPHLQQEVVAPVSTRASTSTPAMETLTKINSYALLNAGATTVPIWPLWHPLAPSGTLWHPLAPSGTLWHPLAPSGTLWHPLAPSGTPWHPLAPSGTLWYTLAPSGTLWHPLVPSGTLLHPLAPSGTLWHHLAPSGTLWHRLAPSGAFWHRLVSSGFPTS